MSKKAINCLDIIQRYLKENDYDGLCNPAKEIIMSKKAINYLDIIQRYLKENDYDGLCNPNIECGCGLNDNDLCLRYDLSKCFAAHRGDPAAGEKKELFYIGKRRRADDE